MLTILLLYLCSMISPTTKTTLFPYTTLFRSITSGELIAYLENPLSYRGNKKGPPNLHEIQISHLTDDRSEEHTSELQSRGHLVCRLLLEKKKNLVKVLAY